LLGQKPKLFFFTTLDGEPVPRDAYLERIAILVWFSDHPACETSLRSLQALSDRWPDREVALAMVCTEPAYVSNTAVRTLCQRWQLDTPVVRDLEAFGRDVFRIPWAPTTVILDAEGTIQYYEVGSNPGQADSIAAVVMRLLQGEDVAAEILAAHRQAKAEYQAALAASELAVPQEARQTGVRYR
jgi:hypothetical protein